jgi:hypothetical protein
MFCVVLSVGSPGDEYLGSVNGATYIWHSETSGVGANYLQLGLKQRINPDGATVHAEGTAVAINADASIVVVTGRKTQHTQRRNSGDGRI